MKRHLTIHGGGLAGLSLGIALRSRGMQVSVIEAGSYPRHRVCGEFISGVTTATLQTLGIAQLFNDARQHVSLAWYERGNLLHSNRFPTPALGISRYVLDDRLRETFESLGGELILRQRSLPQPQEGHVWAAGRRPKPGRWIGLKAHVRLPSIANDLEMHVGTNGYAGLAGVEDGWTNVCGLFLLDRTLDARGPDLLPAYLEAGGNARIAAALRTSSWREGSFSAVAGFELGRQEELPELLCVGDAESMIPPFTGNGMSMAFQAAESAIDPILSWSRGASWPDTITLVRERLRRRFRRRLAVAQLLHRALFNSFGRSAIGSLAQAHALPFRPILSLIR